jgi:hypothetical protein
VLALNPRHDEARLELERLKQAQEEQESRGGGLFKRFKGAR